MRKNPYFVNIVLVIIVTFVCLIKVTADAFYPGNTFPRISIPMLVLFSVIALVVEFYVRKDGKREFFISSMIGALSLSVLPVCIGWNDDIPFGVLFAVSFILFFILNVLYKSIGERVSSASYNKLSPLANGLLLYLASQCLQGVL